MSRSASYTPRVLAVSRLRLRRGLAGGVAARISAVVRSSGSGWVGSKTRAGAGAGASACFFAADFLPRADGAAASAGSAVAFGALAARARLVSFGSPSPGEFLLLLMISVYLLRGRPTQVHVPLGLTPQSPPHRFPCLARNWGFQGRPI